MQIISNRQKSLIVFLFLGLVVLLGCKKDPSTIGLNVQPPGDRIISINQNTTNVSAWTFGEEPITSDERTLNLLGCYMDPIFGKSSASIVTQFRLSSSNVSFGAITKIDSVVLSLAYCRRYGDTLSPQKRQRIKVFGLIRGHEKPIKVSDTLYSNFPVNNYTDSTKKYADIFLTHSISSSDSVLRIKLDTLLADAILRTDATNLVTPDLFSEYVFQGLYIYSDSLSPGAFIMYFNLLSSKTKLSLYYNGSTTPYNLVINNYCARATLFQHNNTTAPFYSYKNDTTSVNNDKTDYVYTQSMGGVRTKLKFPSLSTWKDSGNIAINKAELLLKVDEVSIGCYEPPTRLLLLAVDQNGKYKFVDDYLKNKKYFGGYYNSDLKSYKFNVPVYIQNIISGKQKDYGLFVIPESNRVSGNRVVIKNYANNGHLIKLNLTYTKLR
ncbi:MAG: DUF4270 family protein [Bacteroidia bacterium]|nr:DUF4270 family protein [Bacteroidia bacterium]